jgi:hypothetical protein
MLLFLLYDLIQRQSQTHDGLMYKSKQDRQCTYNVTLRRLRETTVAVEKQWL